METAVGTLTGIQMKQPKPDVTVYEYTVEGIGVNKPLALFGNDGFTPDYTMQGRKVNVSWELVETPVKNRDTGQVEPGRYWKNYYLKNIMVVEGDSGTLDDVLAPQVQAQAVQTVVDRATNGAPASPSQAITESDRIQKAVALKAAVEIAASMLAQGKPVDPATITGLAAQFEPYLSGQS